MGIKAGTALKLPGCGTAENPDRISPGVRNGVSWHVKKPGQDFAHSTEWGKKTWTGFFWNTERRETQTGF